jgi:hypothetical protein
MPEAVSARGIQNADYINAYKMFEKLVLASTVETIFEAAARPSGPGGTLGSFDRSAL